MLLTDGIDIETNDFEIMVGFINDSKADSVDDAVVGTTDNVAVDTAIVPVVLALNIRRLGTDVEVEIIDGAEVEAGSTRLDVVPNPETVPVLKDIEDDDKLDVSSEEVT